MNANMYEVLLFNDQFFIEKKINETIKKFNEGDIQFAPTYKLISGKDIYFIKGRIPGWTDRILYCGSALTQKSYDSNNLMK